MKRTQCGIINLNLATIACGKLNRFYFGTGPTNGTTLTINEALHLSTYFRAEHKCAKKLATPQYPQSGLMDLDMTWDLPWKLCRILLGFDLVFGFDLDMTLDLVWI